MAERYCKQGEICAEYHLFICKFVSLEIVLKHSPPLNLDLFDRKILAILQRDNATPQREIGEAVNLSAPAVQRRIKRMTERRMLPSSIPLRSANRSPFSSR
jgi:DNA-binding MarR family transcriptional regulator